MWLKEALSPVKKPEFTHRGERLTHSFPDRSRQPVFSSQPSERLRSQVDLQVSFSTVLISRPVCLSVCVRPPDGPGAESRPPSHPRHLSHRQEEACVLQRLPAEVQLTGERLEYKFSAESDSTTA